VSFVKVSFTHQNISSRIW